MKISYDPKKNLRNIIERGLSFDEVELFEWETAVIIPDIRFAYPEPRFTATGFLGETERLHVVCFTPTEEGLRVNSLRKANKREVKRYETQTIN